MLTNEMHEKWLKKREEKKDEIIRQIIKGKN